jgi:N-sulfoglucosamine sulfohydrolase
LMNVLKSDARSGFADASRNRVILGRERTDIGRPGNVGYPVRAIRTTEYMYAHNFKPDRWPSGNPETGYKDVDDSPTKRLVIELKDQGQPRWWELAFGMRGGEELYDIRKDPGCVINLAGDTSFAPVKEKLWKELQETLKQQQDPRILGNGDVFDKYEYVGNSAGSWDNVMGGKKGEVPAKGKGKSKGKKKKAVE